ncbi:MAG: AAA family ATPase, partial [Chloroflexi bacterium]|nr:AAA family ATPase [Chloroflexota bacterium]
MRIRELYFNNFRSFRGERTISFVDPLSDTAQPVTVLAGSNGSGKTTILNAIEALLTYMLNPNQTSDFMREAWDNGLVRLTLEVSPGELVEAGTLPPEGKALVLLNIAVGQSNLAPSKPVEKWENLTCHLVPRGGGGNHYKRKSPQIERFRKNVKEMLEGWQELQGGLLYFPYERQI